MNDTTNLRTRYLRVTNASEATVERYLPANYEVACVTPEGVWVLGHDNAGWTLDDYVIPRLASGLYFAVEVTCEDIIKALMAAGPGAERDVADLAEWAQLHDDAASYVCSFSAGNGCKVCGGTGLPDAAAEAAADAFAHAPLLDPNPNEVQ